VELGTCLSANRLTFKPPPANNAQRTGIIGRNLCMLGRISKYLSMFEASYSYPAVCTCCEPFNVDGNRVSCTMSK
jgi:hypothetical protein